MGCVVSTSVKEYYEMTSHEKMLYIQKKRENMTTYELNMYDMHMQIYGNLTRENYKN
jgi:hypothetical protein